MTSIEELTISAVRSAMAPGYEQETAARSLCQRSGGNVTALRIARARVERGAGWRAGPIGQRAREALTRAIALTDPDEIDLTESGELAVTGGTEQNAEGLAHQ